jgi:hypothetical protein
MTSPNAPDPVTLAKIAAQLNPQLACDDPSKAIELARKLLIAADPELAKQEADRAEDMELQKETQRHDELFLPRELILVAEAFKASPGDYMTESGFAAALRKEKLTTVLQDVNGKDREVTTIRAVYELFTRQRKAKQERERERKAASKKKSQKMSRNPKVKSGTNPPKSGTQKTKSGSGKPKSGSLRKQVKFPEKTG